ncbi:hypothetical protein BGX28_002001 [Mortierella sp. GBA30]|nr:hypothetical protein BGX28_002001 [Mortierella sp. GBA30]
MLHQQQQQQQQQQLHFATGHQQLNQQQQKPTHQQQQFHRAARPASEILPQNHHHPFQANAFQSPEAEAIDKWFEDLSHYEQTLEEMAVVSLDTQMAKKDPVGALLSPTHTEKDPVQSQLHGAMAKAEMEASQRLLNVLPIQPPATLDRPAVHRRLYDRHSVAIGESEEYNRLFRRDGKRNSIDFLGSRTANTNNNNNSKNNNNTNISNSSVGSGSNALNGGNSGGHVNGVIGSGVLSEAVSARVNQFGRPAQGSLNRISAPNMFGGNRPKSVHEGDTSSMFSSNWNFASLGATPLHGNNSSIANGNLSSSSASSSSSTGSPGNIGDRTSFGRPKSVGGAEWMLSGSSSSNNNSNNNMSNMNSHRSQSVAEGLEKPWMPLLMSPPTMGGFHNGTNGTGHNLSAGSGFSNSSSSSGLAVERPKSVTEADFAKLNISQWVHNNNQNNKGNNVNGAAGRSFTLEELKANNRRRTLLRPSAIISNVPVTVLEGDEKLLSASANTSSINIVSTMFDESGTATGPGSGPGSVSDLNAAMATNSSQGDSIFSSQQSYSSSQPPVNSSYSQPQHHQQQAVQQLQNLSLDPIASSLRTTLQQQQQQQQLQQQQQQQQYQPLPRPPSQQSRSRAPSPFTSPLPSPIKSGFRSRPVSGPTSPHLPPTQHGAAWGPGSGSGSGNNNNSLSHLGTDGSAIIVPTDYNQKRHLSPPGLQRPRQHSPSVLDDDYLSDTSDISSIGMNGHHHHHHHGRGGSISKEKKQPEGVDFELLQDTPAWLRSLRLHKYNNIFEGMQWRDIVNLSDGDLINKGVAALGARRKMLKVFEQVRKEMLLQGMVI